MITLLLAALLTAPPATGEVTGYIQIGVGHFGEHLSGRIVTKGAGYSVLAYNYDIGKCHPIRFRQLMPCWEKYLVAKTEADDDGDYVLRLPPGTYLIVAIHPKDNLMGWPVMDRSRKRFRRPKLLTVTPGGKYAWRLAGEHISYPPANRKTP
jgi:hypothetical protein